VNAHSAEAFSSDFFNDDDDVRAWARDRVSDIVAKQYPAADAGAANEAAKHLAEAVLKKIEAGEPFDILTLSTRLVREFLAGRGFKAGQERQAEGGDRKARAQGRRKKSAHPGRVRPNDDLPMITVTEADIKEAVDRSEAALIAADLGVYQRDGALVSVTVGKGVSHKGSAVTYQSIATRGEHALVEDLSRSAHYQKWDSRVGNGGDYVQTSASRNMAPALPLACCFGRQALTGSMAMTLPSAFIRLRLADARRTLLRPDLTGWQRQP
jgi:hypothetical protein